MTNEEQTIANLRKLKSFHNGSYGVDIDRAIKAIEQTRWTPVTEKLPEENIHGDGQVWKHKVLIKGYLSFDDKKELFITTAFIEDVRNKCVPNTIVIAWMPLPQL